MLEVMTEALVLEKEPSGEYNSRVFLYTKELGGVVARATSLRKMTSKMAAHLEPLNFVSVRLIAKNEDSGWQIGDALTHHASRDWRTTPEALRLGLRLSGIFKEGGFRGEADEGLWNLISEIFSHPPEPPLEQYAARLLSVLGYDQRNAICGICAAPRPKFFSTEALVFYCASCQEVKTRLR